MDKSREAHRAEELYERFFDQAPIGQVIAALDGTILRVNATLAAMLGYSVEDLQTRSFLSMTHPDDVAASREGVRILLAGERKTLTAEQRVLAKDGSQVWVEVTTGLQRDSDARPVQLVAYVVDITLRKQAEIDRTASETRYRRLFESAKDGILILDADTGRIVDVNPFMSELTAYTRQDFLGAFLWEIGPFKDAVASKVSFAELQAMDYVRYDDLPLKTRDGRRVEVEFVSNVYLVNEKRVIQCNVRDVTQRKRAEFERARLAAAIDQAAEAVVMTDASGAIEYVNPAFEAVTGYSKVDAIGSNPRILKSGMQDERFYRALWETISAGGIWRGRLVNRRKDGALFTEDATISPVRDVAGVITGYVAVKRDITASLALESQLLHAQKMEAVGRLAGGVAHDFNNLLTVILSYAEMIGSDLKPHEPIRGDIEEIKRAALRAADLTRQLLAFSRHSVLEPKVLNLNESLAAMERMLGRLLGADIELAMLPEDGLWNVEADPGQVEQVIMNLAVNARDAMPQGGKLTLETANVVLDDEYALVHHDVRPGSYVELAVSDNGIGMDKETTARVFEPFFTTKERGKGTGLGLATVFGIVKQSGGHIFVYSEPGTGTTFKVYFPRVGAAVSEARSSVPIEPEAQGGGATILLVEDDDQVRILARSILRRQGYVVLDAPNGGEALLICEEHGANIDLLLALLMVEWVHGAHDGSAGDVRPRVQGAAKREQDEPRAA